MLLKELISVLQDKEIIGNLDIDIKGITHNSKDVKKDYLFVAIKGFNVDGHDFIDEAIKNGAIAVVCNKKLDVRIAQIIVKDSRKALALLSAKFYDYPARKIKLIGVTGTNGKGTTALLIQKILSSKYKVGYIGTMYYDLGDKKIESKMTTPDVCDLHRMLRYMVDRKVDYCIMEVSSGSLLLDRLIGIDFDCGVFTNFSEDHLDVHDGMDDYFHSKLTFLKNQDKLVVVNNDDIKSKVIRNDIKSKVITYGIKNKADVMAKDIIYDWSGSSFLLKIKDKSIKIKTKLIGEFNVYNILAAISSCLNIEDVREGIESMDYVPGRFELIKTRSSKVIIDYANNNDALLNLFKTIRALKHNKIISVFGCAGDRKHYKRRETGRIFSKYSDYCILTSDNPRKEYPLKIIMEIEKGLINKNYRIIEDRKKAIKFALKFARKDDVVLIVGKGSENYQVIKDEKIPFNDKEAVTEILKND